MIKEKHKIEEYDTPEYLQQFVDKGIIKILGKEFVPFKTINVRSRG